MSRLNSLVCELTFAQDRNFALTLVGKNYYSVHVFTIAAKKNLKTEDDHETVFLYADESGETVFLEIDVRHELRNGQGNLLQTHYLGCPLSITEEQAKDWRRVLKNFHATKQQHYSGEVDNVKDLRAMSQVNDECFNAVEQYIRVQREMREVQSAGTRARFSARGKMN